MMEMKDNHNQKGNVVLEQNDRGEKPKDSSLRIKALFKDLYFKEEDKSGSILFIITLLLIGCFIMVIYAISIGWEHFISTVGIAFTIAFSSSMVGGFLGFIFGIPRTHASSEIGVGANTNLEEISDWITKIIVGVSLVELDQIREGIVNMANVLARGLGSHDSSFVFSISVITFYFIGGFFLGYLWSRIFLPKILRDSQLAGLIQNLEEKTTQVSGLKKEVEDKDIKEELRVAIDQLAFKAKPENLKDFDPKDFDQQHLKVIIDDVIKSFNITTASKLYGKLIITLYDLAKSNLDYYKRINELTDLYKGVNGLISPQTWTDVALSNLNLYDLEELKENSDYKVRMIEALSKIRQNKGYSDYGVAFAIELYYNLIDYEFGKANNDDNMTETAQRNMKAILEVIIKHRDLTSWEIFSYFGKNTHLKWTQRHDILQDLFPDLYDKIKNKSENYIKAIQQIK